MGYQHPPRLRYLLVHMRIVLMIKIYSTNPYTYVIGMMFYLESNTRPDIYFSVNQCDRHTHNTKESPETSVKRIC